MTATEALTHCPLEWTDVSEAAKCFPENDPAPLSRILEDLERQGLIEVRIHGGRAQIRKAAPERAA